MSLSYMVKAFETNVGGNSLRKLVLLKLADNADDKGMCFPSYQYIADQCECSRRAVINHVNALVEMGLVTIFKRGDAGKQTSNSYRLTLDKKASERNALAGNAPSESNDQASEPDSPPSERGSPLASEPDAPESVTLSNQSVNRCDGDDVGDGKVVKTLPDGRQVFKLYRGWTPSLSDAQLKSLAQLEIKPADIERETQLFAEYHIKTGQEETQEDWVRRFLPTIRKFANANRPAEKRANVARHPATPLSPEAAAEDSRARLQVRVDMLKQQSVDYELTADVSLEEHEKAINNLEFELQMAKYKGAGNG